MNTSNSNSINSQWQAEADEAFRLERAAINELQAEAATIEAENIINTWFDARDEYLAEANNWPVASAEYQKAVTLAWTAEDRAARWGQYRYSLMNPSRAAIKQRISEIRQREDAMYERMDQIA